MVMVLSRLSHLDLAQAFRLVGFLSVPLTGIGVFAFAWMRLTDVKPIWMRQVIGLAAALIYVVSPIAWIWLVRWGFYSESISHIFVPWIIIFFDIFLDELVEEKKGVLFRLSLVLTLIFLVLGTLTHFFAAVGVVAVLLILGFTKFLSSKKPKFVLFKSLFVWAMIFGILFLFLAGFRLLPYVTYNKDVAIGGFTGYAAGSSANYDDVAKNMLTPGMMLSLTPPSYNINDFINFSRSTIADATFPFYVWLLIVPALALSFFKSKKIFALSLYTVFGFVLNTSVGLQMFINQHLGPLSLILTFTTGRIFWISMSILMPVIAVYGAYILWGLIGDIILSFAKRIKAVYFVLYPVLAILILVCTVVTAGYVIYKYFDLPYTRPVTNIGGFNDKLDLRDIWHKMPATNYVESDKKLAFTGTNTLANFDYMNSICLGQKGVIDFGNSDICSYFLARDAAKTGLGIGSIFPPSDQILSAKKKCDGLKMDDFTGKFEYCKAYYPSLSEQLKLQNWVKPTISSDASGETAGLSTIFAELPTDVSYRFDMSGFTGRYIMTAPLVTNNSLIQTYINTLSLIYNNWNYQSQSMYTQFPLYEKPGVLSQIARWFGIDYVFLTKNKQEPLADYANDPNWEWVSPTSSWLHFKPNPPLASWDNRPRMLVISDNSKFFYDQTFRFFTWGGLPYEQAIPVEGNKDVDSYSLSDLEKFDVIFMRGYGYKFKPHAYSLLDSYVKQGGKLIFDTGWQYLIPDWQIASAPSFMPFDSLSWQNLPTNSSFKIEDPTIAGQVDASQFGPLTWENTSWGVSVPGKLRSWAKPVLTYDGKPLAIAGNYGKGEVLWFGFNIIPHAEAKDNQAEVDFFGSAVDNLILNQQTTSSEYKLSYRRDDPDHVTFKLNENVGQKSDIYFRESYYPDWKASISSGGKNTSLKIYRAGPGFMMIEIPSSKSGDIVTLKIVKPFSQRLVEILSWLVFITLLAYLVYPKIFKFIWSKIPFDRLPKISKLPFKFGKSKFFNEDENENY